MFQQEPIHQPAFDRIESAVVGIVLPAEAVNKTPNGKLFLFKINQSPNVASFSYHKQPTK